MYRHAGLRLPCERCAVEQPTRAMILSPSGAGYLCWPCQLRAQIAEHQSRPQRTPGQVTWPEILVFAVVLGGVLWSVLRAWANIVYLH
jgi:hypothetical protein